MSGIEIRVVLPLPSLRTSVRRRPDLSRSWMYPQNWVCFLAGYSYSSHTMA
jgi:hypothetical protein